MKWFISVSFSICMLGWIAGCQGQTKPGVANVHGDQLVGGGCDGCELMYVDMPAIIAATDTSPGWKEAGQKLLIKGKLFKIDGKTPAPNVVIYYWQTNTKGYYEPSAGMPQKARPHGHIRGWVKTDSEGNYAIYTIKPGAYPAKDFAAHIHTSIKEPDLANEYYIDEFVFDDDPLLTSAKRKAADNRGGSGILKPIMQDGLLIANHDIVLGLNIPGYPSADLSK